MSDQKYYTRRKADAPFPECLMVEPTGDLPLTESVKSWTRLHNAAIDEFKRRSNFDVPERLRHERAILSLADGIRQWIAGSGYGADGMLGPNVTVPLFQAFISALDGDCGPRLDCGTLCSWAQDELYKLGFDPNTGDWRKGVD